MATTMNKTETKNLIKKQRKKLREIEQLERLNRTLSPDERVKVKSKRKVRKFLQTLLSDYVKEAVSAGDSDAGGESTSPESKCAPPQLGFCVNEEEASHRNEEMKVKQDLDEGKSGKVETVRVPRPVRVSAGGAKVKKRKPSLSTKSFEVTTLKGHSDLVTALVIHQDTVVTASRDTTVKTWDISTGFQKKNFGGHTDTVTCLIVLGAKESQMSVPDLVTIDEPVIVSGSFDCSLKVWSLHSGSLLKSIYTYNPVSQIANPSLTSLIALGSDTGKLELWDLNRGEQRYSIHAYDASVTGLKVVDKQLQSSASSGTIKVHSITDDMQLTCIFESENVLSTSGRRLTRRHVRSLELCDKGMLIGDDGVNIKLLNWKKNEASKIANHHSDFSSADAIRCHGGYMVASSYDLDSGLGYLNVWSNPSLEYQATLDDKDTERILCVDLSLLSAGDCDESSLVIVTGGVDLKLWHVLNQHARVVSEDVFQAEFRDALAQSAVDSQDEDDDDDDEDDDDEDDVDDDDDDDDDDGMGGDESATGLRLNKKVVGFQSEVDTWWSWNSWCSLV